MIFNNIFSVMDGEQRQQLESILDNMNKEKINESETPPAASSPPQNHNQSADPWPPRSDSRKDRDRRNSGRHFRSEIWNRK